MDEFIAGQRNNLDQVKQSPYFKELIGALDAAYRASVDSVPTAGFPPIFGRILLVCHKSMLSAATVIAQGQPEDSVGITRRAVEAARVALAIKLDEENGTQWTQYQKRHDRWLKRQQNEKPKSFQVQFKGLQGDVLIERMDTHLGIMSDASVHFTPEFYSTLDWEVRHGADGFGEFYLNYFQRNTREIALHLLGLGSTHKTILESLDKCYDGCFQRDKASQTKISEFVRLGVNLNEAYRREYVDAERPD